MESRDLFGWAFMVKTRVCTITNEYFPRVGGIQKVASEQIRLLIHRNYEPFIVTNRINTPKSYVYDGIRVECYNALNTGFRIGIPYNIPSVPSLKTFLKATKTSDIIHAHGHPYLPSLIMGKLAKRYSKPFVLTQHNTFINYDNMFNTLERLNDLTVGKESLKDADKIIAVSNATKDYVLSLGAQPKKIKVLHNGVNMAHFRIIQGKQEEMRKKIGIPKNATVVLTVRRLVYKNGIDTLISAADSAVKKNPNIFFVVVGTGPNKNSAQTTINQLELQNNFRLTGFVSDEELPAYYNVADFFVVPSKSGEGLPLVALEAMACGLPVVATNVGGINEILIDGYGTMVPPNTPDQMAKAILEYSKTDFSSHKSELRAITKEKHSWNKNVDELVKIYEELT
ncbi:MAG: hypothetical protein CW716_11920 [Candidatus Bathyarchaeum sp.]|nr:MAG: hypothetical protein CW716_11920 [Candidatus Bathyarchaeum sp.]